MLIMSMSTKTIPNFRNTKILVVGDIILDLYLRGTADRISPEAPVPIIKEATRSYALGGAGNVACNIATLRGKATLIGVVGSDQEGKIVRTLCRDYGILEKVFIDTTRPTSLKTRAVAMRQQLIRVDREATHPISKEIENALLRTIKSLPAHDFVVVSDYLKGTVTKPIIKALVDKFGKEKIVADIKPKTIEWYRGIYALTPNIKETFEIVGIVADSAGKAEKAAKTISTLLDTSVVITRGDQGMTVYDGVTGIIMHTMPHPVNIFDVTGAGDTVIATLALMLASGASLADAAKIADYAAHLAVTKEGTAPILSNELKLIFAERRKRA